MQYQSGILGATRKCVRKCFPKDVSSAAKSSCCFSSLNENPIVSMAQLKGGEAFIRIKTKSSLLKENRAALLCAS